MQKSITETPDTWETMLPEGKRRELYKRQAAMLATFLEHGTISKAQYDKSLHDLTVKMGYGSYD